jgi:membrane fusion protein (multidrug efflux system)
MGSWHRGVRAGLIAFSAGLLPGAAPAPLPPAVLVSPVEVRDVAPAYDFIGRVTPIQSVQIVPRITAFIEEEPVAQGADVKAGDVLFELQKTQYQAAVQSAQAQLDSANAGLRLAQLAYARAAQLNNQGVESQATLDQATATRDQNQASVLGAQANLAQAALNLSYSTIRSPIDGRIGAIILTRGNLVTPSTPALATVNQLDPIRVVFSVSDRVLVGVERRTGSTVGQIAEGLVVGLILPDRSRYGQTGTISFFNNQVDPQTGTVSVYVDFPNPDRLLLPGSFVSVDVRNAQPEESAMVSVAAVQTDQSGHYVLTVTSDGTVHQQPVTLGRQIAQDFIVTKGLSAGDRVIVDGVQKVRPGEKVNAQSAPAPTPTASGAAQTNE